MRHNQFSHYKRSDTLAGDFMRYKPNQYLICDSYGNYYLRITLPVYMQPFLKEKGRLSEVCTQVIFVLHVESVIRLQMNTIAYGRVLPCKQHNRKHAGTVTQ